MPRAPAGVSSSHLVDATVASPQKAVPRDALPGEHAANLLQADHRSSGVLQGWVEDGATNPCPLLNKISSVILPLLCKVCREGSYVSTRIQNIENLTAKISHLQLIPM